MRSYLSIFRFNPNQNDFPATTHLHHDILVPRRRESDKVSKARGSPLEVAATIARVARDERAVDAVDAPAARCIGASVVGAVEDRELVLEDADERVQRVPSIGVHVAVRDFGNLVLVVEVERVEAVSFRQPGLDATGTRVRRRLRALLPRVRPGLARVDPGRHVRRPNASDRGAPEMLGGRERGQGLHAVGEEGRGEERGGGGARGLEGSRTIEESCRRRHLFDCRVPQDVFRNKINNPGPEDMASRLTLFHVKGFRSSRALWLLRELELAYTSSSSLPASASAPTLLSAASALPAELRVLEFDDPDRFRAEKPRALMEANPNGKVCCCCCRCCCCCCCCCCWTEV